MGEEEGHRRGGQAAGPDERVELEGPESAPGWLSMNEATPATYPRDKAADAVIDAGTPYQARLQDDRPTMPPGQLGGHPTRLSAASPRPASAEPPLMRSY